MPHLQAHKLFILTLLSFCVHHHGISLRTTALQFAIHKIFSSFQRSSNASRCILEKDDKDLLCCQTVKGCAHLLATS